MDVQREFAGAERMFRLRLGEIMDIEEACGKLGLGAIYLRLCRHEWSIREVRHILRIALAGGGLPAAEATRLVDERLDAGQLVKLHGLALDLLISVMESVEPEEAAPKGDPGRTMDVGEIFAGFARMGIPPEEVRAIRYADFVLMARAMGGPDVKPPSEDEFKAMLARYEERYVAKH
jgi:hypothetical protein